MQQTCRQLKPIIYFSCFKIVLPLPPQNEIKLLSRFFCYSKLVSLFGFGLRKAQSLSAYKETAPATCMTFLNAMQIYTQAVGATVP